MSGVTQAVFMNQRSFGPPVPSGIGAAYEGGFYAGQISTSGNGVATHYLVVAPKSSGEFSGKTTWATGGQTTTATSNINGPANTAAIIAFGNPVNFPAANFCYNLTIGGFSDWYLPAQNELKVCYFNLKPGTANNSTALNSGVNDNSVPARTTAYTTTDPARTSVSSFQYNNAESFIPENGGQYWSSTQTNYYRAFTVDFYNGYRGNYTKDTSLRVRAVRRVAL